MRARTFGPRISCVDALTEALEASCSNHVEITVRDGAGEERPWIVETVQHHQFSTELVVGRFVEGGIDLVPAGRAAMDAAGRMHHDGGLRAYMDALDDLRAVVARAIAEAREAGWRVERVAISTGSGRSTWHRADGQVHYEGARGPFHDYHSWPSATVCSEWRTTESDVPWLAPMYTAHDLASMPEDCVTSEHVADWLAQPGSAGTATANGLRTARRLATDRPDDAAGILEILAQITQGRTREILLDRIECLRFEGAATQELPAVEAAQ